MFSFIKNLLNNKTMTSNKKVCMLTIGKVSDTTVSAAEIKRYWGVGAVNVLAVNPSKAEIQELMGYEPKEEPTYVGKTDEGVPTARISFIVRTIPEDCNGIDTTAFLNFNLVGTAVQGSTSGKFQVADNYSDSYNEVNTAWGEPDVVNNNKPIIYSNGTNPMIGSYHKICRGEVALTNFLRAYLGLPTSVEYNPNGSPIRKSGDALEESKLRLENIANYFKGDFSEIKEAISLMPNNKVKVIFGVRTNDEGKQYQDVNNEIFISAKTRSSKSSKHAEKVITDAKNAGRYANVDYSFEPLCIYAPTPTEMSEPANDLPFESPWN